MRKKFFSLLALLLLCGVSFAASIPSVVDPKAGPEVWLVDVYNNSGSSMDVGDVAVWQFTSATGSNDNYVTTTTTAATYLTAGVVYPSAIAAGDSGTIAVRGPVQVDTVGVNSNLVPGGSLCTSSTAGAATRCSTSNEVYRFGFAITNEASSSVTAFVDTTQ